ncbi:MAG: hypothetical protein WKF97_17010 [Chitinophagaceae bacterium]
MAEQKIELRKIRDFGENLNDTLLFIRQNFKPLVKSFFAICAVFMVAKAILSGLNQFETFNSFSQIFKERMTKVPSTSVMVVIKPILTLLFVLITMVSMQVALGAYIKYYALHDGLKPGIEEVWSIFKKYFFKILLYSVPLGLYLIIGFALCIFPGIYLWVVFMPFPLIVMIEETQFADSWRRCFELIRENFWISLGIYLIAYLIYNFISAFIGLGVGAIMGIGAYLTTDDLATTAAIITSFLETFSYCFYIIFFICISFHYFTLVEIKEGTGMLRRINSIGTDSNNVTNSEEQY